MAYIEDNLKRIAEEFDALTLKYEKRYIIVIMLYFLGVGALSYLTLRFYPALYVHLAFKITIILLLLLGLGAHFTLKNTFFKSNKIYNHFLEERLLAFQKGLKVENITSEELYREIASLFEKKQKDLTESVLKKDFFWKKVIDYFDFDLQTENNSNDREDKTHENE